MPNSQPLSLRLRSLQRVMREARTGAGLSPNEGKRLERLLGEYAAEAEQVERGTRRTDVVTLLRAAGSDVSQMRAALDAAPRGRRSA